MIRWSKASYALLSAFLLVIVLIGYVWWPLLEDYVKLFDPSISIFMQIDWLLIGVFLTMSILIMINADLKHDIPFFLIALAGGYIIESWGTISGLWTYYTLETPPFWIIPAWPIAALSVNRLYLLVLYLTKEMPGTVFKLAYWPIFIPFLVMLFYFSWPALSFPLSIIAILLCLFLIVTEKDKRSAILIFVMGSLLGYFLERWGTTRLCWEYYTGGTPPFFTVIAHGMASIAVWRFYRLYFVLIQKSNLSFLQRLLPDRIN